MSRSVVKQQDSRDSSSDRHVSFSPAVRSPPAHRRPPPSPVPPDMTGSQQEQMLLMQHSTGSGHLHPVSLLEHPECALVIPCPVAHACPVIRQNQQEEEEEAEREECDDGEETDADAETAATFSAGGHLLSPSAGGEGGNCAISCPFAGCVGQQLLGMMLQLLANKSDSAAAMSQQSLLPGIQAPEFAGSAVMPDQSFANIRLSDYRGKYVVLFFYPADFTFVCPTEIIAFSDRAEEFRKANCELIACSTDTHFVHLAWTNTQRKDGGLGRLDMPLLADPSHAISRAYGVLKPDAGIAFRGLFIISETGVLRQITINDLPVGRSVEETLRLVQAFQFTDKHGEVCPANWKPGGKTMKPDPVKSKEYFKSA